MTHESQLFGVSASERIAKLAAFIGEDLDDRAARGINAAAGCYLLIARSPESPVAQALRSHAARMATMGVRVRAILSEVEQVGSACLTAPLAMPSECRIIRDPRLLAAHEQLSLSPATTWIGDCMRREPGKRDAMERYAVNCAQTGAHAARSFEGLWRATVPLDALAPITSALAQMSELVSGGEALPYGLRRQ